MLHYNVFKKHLNNLIAQALAVANEIFLKSQVIQEQKNDVYLFI